MSTSLTQCNRPVTVGRQLEHSANDSAIVIPMLSLGDTSRLVTIDIDLKKVKKPGLHFTDLAFNKSKGFLLMKDDGLASDYNIVYKVLSGGIIDGQRYPGFSYTDGAGKNIGYKYSFAINPNEEHSSSSNVTSWSQISEMVSKGHSMMNHTLNHGGTDKLKALKDAEKNLWRHTHYRMTEIAIPSNEEGFVETGIQLGYPLISSEFGEPVPDGNNNPGNENISWGSVIRMESQNFNKVLISRTNLGDQWNSSELKNSKSFVDYVLNHPEKSKKLIGAAFSHGPFGDHKEGAKIFFDFINYIKHHPGNRDSVWMTSSKELMDYVKTKAKVKVIKEKYDPAKGKYHIVLDMDAVDPNVIYRNMSFLVQGGEITNVKATGINDVTFNPKTGLVNIYKTDRSRIRDPFKDKLPPQILKISFKGNIITIVYDLPVKQRKAEAYEIPGNKVLQLRGSGKTWQLLLQNPVTEKQTFYYRMQRGDAAQEDDHSYRVCTYAGLALLKEN
ncbi:hypothetical protein [Pedobacter gandavensis]|uniref:hypothetical protein n=1 Tax=Pedobacter gandavensis TaxID=2679963 RepID=UPI0029310374|nr:hypothetical protein [Pedobacter gandavensis]